MSGSKKTEETKATKDPWAPAQAGLRDELDKAKQYGNDTAMFTPTYSPWTQQGIQGIAGLGQNPMAAEGAYGNLATRSGQALGTGMDALTATANGSMLGANPYLDRVLQTSLRDTANNVNQQFSGAGRYGSGSHEVALADRLGNLENTARMGQYNQERNNQLQAAGLLQGFGQQGGQYAGGADAARAQQQQYLVGAGAMKDAQDTATRTAPLQALQYQAGITNPIAGLGGTQNSTTTTSTPANVPGMIAGGLMTGIGAFTGNPMMVAGGLGGIAGGAAGSSGGPSYGGGGGGGGGNLWGNTYSQAASPSNGNWATTATPAFKFPWQT